VSTPGIKNLSSILLYGWRRQISTQNRKKVQKVFWAKLAFFTGKNVFSEQGKQKNVFSEQGKHKKV
jgi:hypothetical protein